MRRSIAFLVLSLAVSSLGFCQPVTIPDEVVHEPASSLINFDETSRVVPDAGTAAAKSIQLDALAMFTPTDLDVRLGVGLVLRKTDHLRAVAGVANGGVMAGVAYRFIPVLDLSVGVGALWVIRDGDVVPMLYTSIAHW